MTDLICDSFAIFSLTNALFWFSPWPPLNWHFWSCLTKTDVATTNIDQQKSSWALWKAWSVYYLLKIFSRLENESWMQEIKSCKKRWVSQLIHYSHSVVNTKMVWGTPKYHPRLMKFESVAHLLMENWKTSLKLELLDFWHNSTITWATLEF